MSCTTDKVYWSGKRKRAELTISIDAYGRSP